MNIHELPSAGEQGFQTVFDLIRSNQRIISDSPITDLIILNAYYDNSTLSRSSVVIVSVDGAESRRKLAIKRYSPAGFPETEFEAYRLLQAGKGKFKEYPAIYLSGHDNAGSPFLIMDYIEGFRLSDILTTSGDREQHANYFMDIIRKLEELGSIGKKGGLKGLVKNSWLKPDTVDIRDFIKKGYKKFSIFSKRALGDYDIDSLIRDAISNIDRMPDLGYSFRHGDVAANNIIISPTKEIAAFLDWEYSFYGPPEKDIADLCVTFLTEGGKITIGDIFQQIEDKGYNIGVVMNFLLLKIFILASVASKNSQFNHALGLMDLFKKIQSLI